MVPHVCHELDYCVCNSMALEPDEDCPIHGGGTWPPRCCECGRFIKWEESRYGTTLTEANQDLCGVPKTV